MKSGSFKKFFFSLFNIVETTDRGKRWKRIVADRQARWAKIVKLTDYRVEAAA